MCRALTRDPRRGLTYPPRGPDVPPAASTPGSDPALEALLARKQVAERRIRSEPELAARVDAVRRWQARRLAATYRDLAADPRQGPAVAFFLNDLYGAASTERRDRELARALKPLKRTLPASVLELLTLALELDALSLELDESLAACLSALPIDPQGYLNAYLAADRAQDRLRQIALILEIGRRLDGIARSPLISAALRAAHLPARLAGFAVLQDFLERGYAAFYAMGSAGVLLEAIEMRETRLHEALLRGDLTELAALT